MARSLWKGSISFGLVNIPIEVFSARQAPGVHFHLLDSRDHSPVGYRKINKSTGKEVAAKQIVKAYEYEDNQYVVVTPEDLSRANPKATQTIDIEDFVDLNNLDILYFEKPYYLVPTKTGRRAYVLLREVLAEGNKVAIARFVMHTKQHLVALIPRGDYLILETLHFADQIREVSEANFLEALDLGSVKISPREVKMARELVKSMSRPWKPERYKNTYEDDLMRMIQQKIELGHVEAGAPVENYAHVGADSKILDLMPLLQRSLEAAATEQATASRRKKTSTRPGKKRSPKTRKAQ